MLAAPGSAMLAGPGSAMIAAQGSAINVEPGSAHIAEPDSGVVAAAVSHYESTLLPSSAKQPEAPAEAELCLIFAVRQQSAICSPPSGKV